MFRSMVLLTQIASPDTAVYTKVDIFFPKSFQQSYKPFTLTLAWLDTHIEYCQIQKTRLLSLSTVISI
jgi:hypothetical protein